MKGGQRRTVLIILIVLGVSLVACSPPTPPRITPGSLASMRALSNTNFQQTQYMGATDDYGEDALAVGPGSTLGHQDPSHNLPWAHVAAQRRFL